MRGRIAIVGVLAAAVAALVAVLLLTDGDGATQAESEVNAWQPAIEIVSPRNGARQRSHAVVVKVELRNFALAPGHFGGEPQLGEGHIRFGLNRVPDCVDPVKLERAIESPIGRGRLVGASFDYPAYSGPNGVLAERIGAAGSYSPATRPEIYYRGLPPGFYRLVINLAQNDGSVTPFHAATNFEILPAPGHGPGGCKDGKVSSAEAAAFD
jgi:hypothetical protein